MPANRRLDRSAWPFQRPGNKREVNFLHFTLRKLAGEMLVGRVIFRDHETAARFFVEAMDDAGTLLAANPGEARAMMQQRVHEGVRLIARPGMNDQSGGLVEDEQIVVLEKNLERNFFRLRLRFPRAAVPLA